MAKKKTPKKKTPVKKKSPPINWLRDWEEFDFSDASGPGEIATRQARVEQIVVEFLSRQNTASYPKNWHFIVWAANIILSNGICKGSHCQVTSLGGRAPKIP